jgi:2-polyprenyl-6-methoxyphenol hydroxylase-like FAD-dependent oxidoreductase
MSNTECPVLIAGGGPVGMTLALNLAQYGVRSILVERNPATTQHPKMDLTNGRSMELYRRLGLTEKLRDAGVPRDNPFDISWITAGWYNLAICAVTSSPGFATSCRRLFRKPVGPAGRDILRPRQIPFGR